MASVHAGIFAIGFLWRSVHSLVHSTRVALCIAGAVRTFPNQRAYGSLKQNLVDVLRQQGQLQVFMHLKKQDESGLFGLRGMQRKIPTASDHTLYAAIQAVGPSMLEFGDEFTAQNPTCQTRINGNNTFAGAVNQIFMNFRCAALIDQFEVNSKSRFTHVVKTRPDLEWKRPISNITGWPSQGARFHDKVYYLPRDAVQPILQMPYEMYYQCDNASLSYDTGAGLWAYKLMQKAQRISKSIPILFDQGNALQRNTLDAKTSKALFPVDVYKHFQKIHYFRVPKTGSKMLVAELESHCKAHVVIHDYGHHLCRMSREVATTCNASFFEHALPFTPTIAVLREPCERFASVLAHIRVKAPQTFGNFTTSQLLGWMENRVRMCKSHSTQCMVRQMSDSDASGLNVILFPQAYYIGSKTRVVCYSRTDFNSALSQEFHASCPGFHLNASAKDKFRTQTEASDQALCSQVRQLYPEDARLWYESCSHR